MSAAEVTFLVAYGEVQHTFDAGRLWGLLLALPVILANHPSEAFVSQLITHGSLREDLLRLAPDYKESIPHALIATAIEAVESRAAEAQCMNVDLNSQIQ